MLRLYLHYLYWILVFFAGIVQLYQLNSAIYKIGIPLLALVMFVFQFIERSVQLKYPYWGIPLTFVVISLLSARFNGIDYFSLINFLIYTILSYAYFVVLVNENHLVVVPKIIRFLKVLIFIQIPAIAVKFLVVGQSEGEGIGTLSQGGGSISTIFPLFMITFLFCLYLYREKRIYIFYLFCFLRCIFSIKALTISCSDILLSPSESTVSNTQISEPRERLRFVSANFLNSTLSK